MSDLDIKINDLDRRLKAVEERLSPPETTGLSEASIRAMEEKSPTKAPPVEDIAAFAEGRDLPPDMWDRYGVRWTPVLVGDKLAWDNGGKLRDFDEISKRGPFTEKSPLAEDQPSEREQMVEKMAAIMTEVEHPHGSGKSRLGRSYTDRLAEAVYDFVLAEDQEPADENPATVEEYTDSDGARVTRREHETSPNDLSEGG